MKFRKPTRYLREQIREEAAEWFVAFCDADVDERGRQEFNLWLRSSPEHVRAYLRLASFWADDDLLTRTRKLDAEVLVQRALEETNVVPLVDERSTAREDIVTGAAPAASVNPRGSRRWMPAAIAATIALIAGVGSILYWQRTPTYATAIGEQRTVTLSDGSTVALNARSSVVVRYSRSQREVELLEGEALFSVVKNLSRPFTVHSGAANIRALGTQFDVYRKSAETLISVIEGRVAVTNPVGPPGLANEATRSESTHREPAATSRERSPGTIFISAGEQLVATPRSLRAPSRSNVAAATAWLEGQLNFEDTPLVDVIDEFNRHNVRQLVIDDAQLRTVRVSGIFSFTGSDQLVEFLRLRMSLVVRASEDEIHISRR